jgi:hypothetical protein
VPQPNNHPAELDDADRTTWKAVGRLPGSLFYAVFYCETRRTWRERLFSWPWRPWVKYRAPIVIDLSGPDDPTLKIQPFDLGGE